MVRVVLSLAVALTVSSNHAQGLELAHAHGQEAWPLGDGDEALIQEFLRLLATAWPRPGAHAAPWTWEDSEASWTFGGLRIMDVETHDSLVHHMLHHHGLAPLIASHADGWDAFLARYEPEEADRADFAAAARTRDAKVLAVAEKQFPQIAALKDVLMRMSLSGLRNLHSYDHQAEWRCKGPFGNLDRPLQAMADARTVNWLRATHTPAVRQAVTQEYRQLRTEVANLDDLKDGRGRHVEDEFLQLSRVQWGAFAPVASWDVSSVDFDLVRRTARDGEEKCFAEGRIEWEGFDTSSRFSVPLSDEECDEVREARRAATAAPPLAFGGRRSHANAATKVSEHVRQWVQGAVARHRAALGAKRGLVWAQEEADFADHDVVLETPRRPSTCAGYRPTRQELVEFAIQSNDRGLLYGIRYEGPLFLQRVQDFFESNSSGGSLLEAASLLDAKTDAKSIIRRVEKQ